MKPIFIVENKLSSKLKTTIVYEIVDPLSPGCGGQIIHGHDGEWCWRFSGRLSTFATGRGSFDQCLKQISSFFGRQIKMQSLVVNDKVG